MTKLIIPIFSVLIVLSSCSSNSEFCDCVEMSIENIDNLEKNDWDPQVEADFREKHAAEYEKCETVMDKMNEDTEGLSAKDYMNYSDKMAEDCPAYKELIKKQSQMFKSKLGI